MLPRHWRARAVVTAAVVSLLAVACGTPDDLAAFDGRVNRQDLAPTTTLPPEPPTTFVSYDDTVECPFNPAATNGLTARCAELTVPMRRDKASSRTVTVAVAIIKSTSPNPKPDPVVYLEGGPGGSAIASVGFWTKQPASFLAERDLILVDQRGTGFSNPNLRCDQLTDDVASAFVARFAEDCVRVLRNAGTDLSGFDTTESAADLHDLRKAMGIAEWNLFGISYGTRLALWTMLKYPHGIRSAIIDSVYPPGVKSWEAVGTNFQRAVRAVAADCAAQPACNAAYPDVEGQLVSALDKMGDRSSAFARRLFQDLYDTRFAPDAPKAIALANRGDLTGAMRLLLGEGVRARHPDDFEDEEPPPGARSRPRMSEALYQSVECAETAPLHTPASVRAGNAALPASLAKPFLQGDLDLLALCTAWKVDPNKLEPVSSDIPTLVMAGTYDPITPPEWAKLAASTLPRSQYREVQGAGHGVWTAGDCPKLMVQAFLNDPTAAAPECPGAAPQFVL